MSRFVNFLGRVMKPAVVLIGKSRLARHAGESTLKGLKEDVEIRRDPRGVPYIYAKSERDLAFGQGYAHAQDRLWQMEVNRRVSNGTLSEVFGRGALDTDRVSRTMGFARLAQEDLRIMGKEMDDFLDAYVSGINAFIKQERNRLPIEFRLAGFKPELFSVLDVLALTRMMSMRLSIGWGHEIAAQKLMDKLGDKAEELMGIRYPKSNPVTLENGIETRKINIDGKFEAMNGPYMHPANGSNAWAITGSRTDTGKPYLCSDPHLTMLLPGIWYQVYMEGGDFRCQGASIPGIPLILIGHNRHISWGITLAFTDIQDLFIEEFNPDSPDQYKFKDEWKTAEIIEEKITIKGEKEPYLEKVIRTDHGTIISDVLDTGAHKMALSSPALESSRISEGWYGLDKAKNWDDFVNALKFIDAPGLNVVYADVEGNIGYWLTGKTPVRGKGKGELPAPGWTGEYDWKGFVPFEEMPHTLNPEKGHVISCNHKIVNDDFSHFMGEVWMNGFRAERLEQLFAEKEGKFTKNDFKKYHLDFQSIPGPRFAALFKDMKHSDPLVQKSIKILTKWDGKMTAGSVGASIYMVTKQYLSRVLFEAEMGTDLWERVIGKGANELFFVINEFQGHDMPLLMDLMENPESEFVKAVGGKEAALSAAIEQATAWLRTKLGSQVSGWKWGKIHKVEFPHAMAVKRPLDKVFNLGPYPIGGDTDTVCQTAFKPHEPFFANQACPSYRQIVDLSDFNKCLWVLPPGQSGQIGSQHYDDQVQAWLKGRYYPMVWDRPKVEKEAQNVLWLRPHQLQKQEEPADTTA